ncbi:cysteine--tRNA ligase [bacterium]|nr:cysteine--tRNA ligase [bacterium]
MALKVYNYATRQKEEFKPLQEGFVGMYVCGPTVYGDSHIGHGKCYIAFDIVNRYLRAKGYRVRYVQNITDVGHLTDDADAGEDKVQKKAKLDQLEPMEVVEKFMRSYFEDMDKLNVIRPDISPRASGHIPEQIGLAEKLIEKGVAYEANGSVFFSVRDWKDYGRLSHRKVDELEESGRIDTNPDKKFHADFAVWRAASPEHIMQWKSPWGQGFPGWHAECTVMSAKYLGLPFDIHGGGLENMFPHNESEIAQAEAAYDTEFANYWLLNNMVTVEGTKMGKSLGNFVTLKDAYTKYDPLALRFFILGSHYRQNTDFSEQAILGASKGYQRLLGYVQRVDFLLKNASVEETIDSEVQKILGEYETRFFAAMDDDFNTPQAIAALFDLGRTLESFLQSGAKMTVGTLTAIRQQYQKLGNEILGVFPEEIGEATADLTDGLMQMLIQMRADARTDKNWALADQIRNKLTALGIQLKDGAEGTQWDVAR